MSFTNIVHGNHANLHSNHANWFASFKIMMSIRHVSQLVRHMSHLFQLGETCASPFSIPGSNTGAGSGFQPSSIRNN